VLPPRPYKPNHQPHGFPSARGAPRAPKGTDKSPAPYYGGLTLKEWVTSATREYLLQVLEETGWVVANAARRAGCNRAHFYTLMSRFGIIREPPWKNLV
jgi:transcriptional regulator with GAF, ATPase, and Fis domain